MAEDLMREHTEDPPGQARTMAIVTAGFVELETGGENLAFQYFTAICRRPSHPRFFLDWYWKMIARYGLSAACLRRGDLTQATAEADALSEAVATAADPALNAQAWEMQARIHLANNDLTQAEECVQRAQAELAVFKIPFAAKKVQATAAEIRENAQKLLQ